MCLIIRVGVCPTEPVGTAPLLLFRGRKINLSPFMKILMLISMSKGSYVVVEEKKRKGV
jgi:hypothetical protein